MAITKNERGQVVRVLNFSAGAPWRRHGTDRQQHVDSRIVGANNAHRSAALFTAMSGPRDFLRVRRDGAIVARY